MMVTNENKKWKVKHFISIKTRLMNIMKDIYLYIGWWVIDIHLDKKKYESYKTELWKRKFIFKILNQYLSSLEWKIINNILLKKVFITSNDYWWSRTCIINDLWYSNSYQVPLNDKFITVRIFQIEVLWFMEDNSEIFPLENIGTDDFLLDICSTEIK